MYFIDSARFDYGFCFGYGINLYCSGSGLICILRILDSIGCRNLKDIPIRCEDISTGDGYKYLWNEECYELEVYNENGVRFIIYLYYHV